MVKFFINPFGVSGDLAAVPDSTDPGGLVSYQTGYTSNYSADPASSPTAKNVERTKFNQILYDITSAIRDLQIYGVPAFITAAQNGGVAFSYGINAVVRYDSGSGIQIYRSIIASNTALPTDTSKWAVANVLSDGNKGDITLASAGTIFTINANSITTSKILDGSVTGTKIADGNITAVKIADANIITAKIADGAVTTVKIADGNIITQKLAAQSVTVDKIQAFGANNVLCNPTPAGATIIGLALNTQQLFGRGTGNLAAIALGTGLAIDGTNTLNSSAGSPAVAGSVSSSAITWNNIPTNTFETEFVLTDLVVSTAARIILEISIDNGATWITAGYTGYSMTWNTTVGGATALASAFDFCQYTSTTVCQGKATLSQYASGGAVLGVCNGIGAGGENLTHQRVVPGGFFNAARIRPSSGTITSGNAYMKQSLK